MVETLSAVKEDCVFARPPSVTSLESAGSRLFSVSRGLPTDSFQEGKQGVGCMSQKEGEVHPFCCLSLANLGDPVIWCSSWAAGDTVAEPAIAGAHTESRMNHELTSDCTSGPES